MKNIVVSIIIPVYNPPIELLEKCVNSVCAQNYEQYEVIIIDDGSNQKIADYLDSLSLNNRRITVMHQSNAGVSAARNRGIENANGKYVCFVDADDCIDKMWLKTAVDLAELEKVDVVYGVVKICNEVPIKTCVAVREDVVYKKYQQHDLWEVQRFLFFNDALQPLPNVSYLDLGPYGKLFRKNVLEQVRFPTGITIGEDQVFNHRVLSKCQSCLICNKIAYYYINNSYSVSHTCNPNACDMMMQAMEEVGKSLFVSEEIKSAYQYAIINNGIVAISLKYFQGEYLNRKYRSIVRMAKRELEYPLLKNAICEIKIKDIPSKKAKMKLMLMKTKQLALLFLIKKMKKVIN